MDGNQRFYWELNCARKYYNEDIGEVSLCVAFLCHFVFMSHSTRRWGPMHIWSTILAHPTSTPSLITSDDFVQLCSLCKIYGTLGLGWGVCFSHELETLIQCCRWPEQYSCMGFGYGADMETQGQPQGVGVLNSYPPCAHDYDWLVLDG